MTRHGTAMVLLTLVVAGIAIWGIARLSTAFNPLEDQGYVVIAMQLTDGASIERTLGEVSAIARTTPGLGQTIEIAGVSPLDNNASLPSAGAVYVVLKESADRAHARGRDLRSIYGQLTHKMDQLPDASGFVIVPPPIQGISNASGFTMMVELRDRDGDFPRLERVARTIVADGESQSTLQHLITPISADLPQLDVRVDRTKVETLQVSVGDVFATLASDLGSIFANQFNKFWRIFEVHAQADSRFRLQPNDILQLSLRSHTAAMVPPGSLPKIRPRPGPSLITFYNLYPAARAVGAPARGFSSGEANSLMKEIAQEGCRAAWVSSGPPCPIGRRRSAPRSIMCSALAFCWPICVSAASTKAESSRSRGSRPCPWH